MCLAIPGKIVSIRKNMATVDYGSEQRKARILEGSFRTGDYVIVQAKVVAEKVPKKQVRKWLSLLKENEA